MDTRVTIITGPIGSGKSTACRYIKEKGFSTTDLDSISNSILESQNSLEFLKDNFSGCLIENKIDKKLLAEVVFTNPDKLNKLENYLHPLVTLQVSTLIQQTTVDLFIEASAPKNIHQLYPTVVIFAEEQVRRERLKSRGMSETDINNRIYTQPEESWWKSLGMLIENTSYTELHAQIDKLLDLSYE
jgi:dephospho-CoA kinase